VAPPICAWCQQAEGDLRDYAAGGERVVLHVGCAALDAAARCAWPQRRRCGVAMSVHRRSARRLADMDNILARNSKTQIRSRPL
jgi:hypothetical protein